MTHNLKNLIKELLIDSSCGDTWGEKNIHFHEAYKMAKVIYSYFCAKKKVLIEGINEAEVEQILKLQIPMDEMYSQGIYFLRGWKSFVEGIEKLQNEEAKILEYPELFLECLENALTINIYENLTEHPQAEWIFAQKAFVKKMAGLAWIWEAVNYEKQDELLYSMQNGIIFFVEEKEMQHCFKQKCAQIQEGIKDISKDEKFIFVLGSLFMEMVDVFTKICAFTDQGLDEVELGRIMLEKIVEQELALTEIVEKEGTEQ